MTNTIPNTGAAGTETGEPAITVTDLAAEKLAEVLA